MGKRRSSAAAAAAQDDSLEVHPATQAAAADGSREPSPALSATDEPIEADSQGFWEAEAILDETHTTYLIAWKGTDEDGEPWKPTWEPKKNANEELIRSWKTEGRYKRDAERARVAQEKKAKKLARKEARKARRSRSSTSSTRDASVVIDERTGSPEVAPARIVSKRKLAVPDSDSSPQPDPIQKKVKKNATSPRKKHVQFDLVLAGESTDEEAEFAAEAAMASQEAAAVASSGSTSASIIPDSQAAPHAPLVEAEGGKAAASPAQPPPEPTVASLPRAAMHSPATSHSDLEVHHDERANDDVAVFDPLAHNDRDSSGEPEHPRLGPVPVPPVSAFHLADSILVRSSQLDPIEDPDSSPRRSPFRRQQSCNSPHNASPRPRPAKMRLELVSAGDDGDSPVSSFELEVQSAAAGSYVSLPMDSAVPVRPLSVGIAGAHFRRHSTVSAGEGIKRPAAPPVVPAVACSIDVVDGVGTATVAPFRRPSVDIFEEAPLFDFAEVDRQDEFFNEIFEFDNGTSHSDFAPSTVPQGKAAGDAQDAGEGYPPSNGYYGGYGTSGAGTGYAPQQQQQQQQQQQGAAAGYAYPPAAHAHVPGGYGFGSTPGYTGGYPSYPPPYGHAHAAALPQQPPKREFDGSEDSANKKARVDQQQHQSPYPAAAHTHSPYTMPHGVAAGPSAQHAMSYMGQPAVPYNYGHYAASYQAAGIASPSLARVQNADAFVAPQQSRGTPQPAASAAPALQAVKPAHNAAAHRSPSPLPPIAAPAAPASPALPLSATGSSFISRNSSPAPSGTKVDEVISLVRSSTQILDTDGTKAEIEKFLRDPKAYAATPNAPLLRIEFWAFELRRHTVDGVEKVDFIILRSREGTFQLKRAAADKLPVEFARSLSHTSTRVRGLTPAVEAVPTLAAFSPARPPPPPAPSTMTREQLEQEVERLRAQAQARETELVSLRPLAAEAAKLKVDVQTLTKTNKSLLSSRESAQSDLSYMQAQYQAASSAAVERANEARAAEEEAAKLRGLLDTGIKQKELVYKGQIKTVKIEYERLKKQLQHYKDESRRTLERGFREKAAKWDAHVAAQNGGAAEPDSEDEGDQEAQPDEDEPEPSTLDVSTSAPSQLPSQVPVAALGLQPQDVVPPPVGTFPTTPALAAAHPAEPPAMPPSSAPSTLDSTMSGPPEFRCEWRVDGETSQARPCGDAQGSREGLREHILSEHVPQ
ncbi:hypothetical protein Rhopal_004209-T1 [Rhodotorula paludigena]|uniref:Chromo domain-containing protein n=1 Tax=Rhodotorula paludigena TaxID=86838 RepID=A0AAV5GFH1_9BASI|nr:hypothetical protein Rhopal_004209-T1 [Rhodotorula paludigena]